MEPIQHCPHIFNVDATSVPFLSKSFDDGCSVCSNRSEIWMCLHCGKNGCSRYTEGHMESHWISSLFDGESGEHCLALSWCDLSVWCYHCNSYIKHDNLHTILLHAEAIKFDSPIQPSSKLKARSNFNVAICCPTPTMHDHKRLTDRGCYERPERVEAIMARLTETALLAKLNILEPSASKKLVLSNVKLAQFEHSLSTVLNLLCVQ